MIVTCWCGHSFEVIDAGMAICPSCLVLHDDLEPQPPRPLPNVFKWRNDDD